MGIAEENAILEAQRAYFGSDEHILDRAARYRGMSPEQCLVEVIDCARAGAQFLAMKSPAELAVVLEPEPLPADTLAILEQLHRRR
jgi:hypothetical protein